MTVYRQPPVVQAVNAISGMPVQADVGGNVTPRSAAEEAALIAAGWTVVVAGATTYPSAPAAFTAGTATSYSQPLAWTAPASGNGPFTYRVGVRATGTNAGFQTIIDKLSALSTVVLGLAPGAQYDYELTASNSLGRGPSIQLLAQQTGPLPTSRGNYVLPTPGASPVPDPTPGLAVFPIYLGAVAGGVRSPDNTNVGVQYINARSPHIARGNITGLQVKWNNVYTNGNNQDAAPASNDTSSASLEYPAGTFTQLKWSGATSVTVNAGGIYPLTDPCPVAIPDGALFWIRHHRSGTGAAVYNDFPTGSGQYLRDIANGIAFENSTTPLADKTMGGTITDASSGGTGSPDAMVYPFLILGQTTRATPVLIGDSRIVGIGDQQANGSTYLGELERSIGPKLGYVDLARAGDTVASFITGNGGNRRYYTSYGTHFVIEYGINDIGGGATAAAVIANMQTLRGQLPAGKAVFLTTLPPQTTSTDGWVTVANQTTQNAGNEAQRVLYNNAVRAGIPGFAGYFEIADQVESARNSGLWKANYTTDGNHESHAGALAIQTSGVVNPNLFV